MKLSREQVADTIDSFVNGTGGKWDWDDFISIRLKDPELEAIRKSCAFMREDFPPNRPDQYCNEKGVEAMRCIVADLRSNATRTI